MENSFEVDFIKFAKGAYRRDDLSYQTCFTLMCEHHYANGFPISWTPSDEWILNRCFEIYEKYFDLKNFTSIISYQMPEYKIKAFPDLMNYFDSKSWRTLIATQLMNALSMLPYNEYDPNKEFGDNIEICNLIDNFDAEQLI